MTRMVVTVLIAALLFAGCTPGRSGRETSGWTSLFNGRDLNGWKVPGGDNGHWRVVDGVIDYDALSEAPGDKNLWTDRSYRDFVLRLDWRLKGFAGLWPMRTILRDGTHLKGPDGKEILTERPNSDSGIYLRGTPKAQINLWGWPEGSGEVWGYRTDQSMPPAVRAALVPRINADRAIGEWNSSVITMRGDRLTVVINGHTVIENAQLPDVPPEGPIGLQHHGGIRNGKMLGSSSLVQFRNIEIQEL